MSDAMDIETPANVVAKRAGDTEQSPVSLAPALFDAVSGNGSADLVERIVDRDPAVRGEVDTHALYMTAAVLADGETMRAVLRLVPPTSRNHFTVTHADIIHAMRAAAAADNAATARVIAEAHPITIKFITGRDTTTLVDMHSIRVLKWLASSGHVPRHELLTGTATSDYTTPDVAALTLSECAAYEAEHAPEPEGVRTDTDGVTRFYHGSDLTWLRKTLYNRTLVACTFLVGAHTVMLPSLHTVLCVFPDIAGSVTEEMVFVAASATAAGVFERVLHAYEFAGNSLRGSTMPDKYARVAPTYRLAMLAKAGVELPAACTAAIDAYEDVYAMASFADAVAVAKRHITKRDTAVPRDRHYMTAFAFLQKFVGAAYKMRPVREHEPFLSADDVDDAERASVFSGVSPIILEPAPHHILVALLLHDDYTVRYLVARAVERVSIVHLHAVVTEYKDMAPALLSVPRSVFVTADDAARLAAKVPDTLRILLKHGDALTLDCFVSIAPLRMEPCRMWYEDNTPKVDGSMLVALRTALADAEACRNTTAADAVRTLLLHAVRHATNIA